MKNFYREDLAFSLCGLNCALCPMALGRHCPGCGGGPGNQSCAIAKCSIEKQVTDYCFTCSDFPCKKYQSIDEWDSFITHYHQLKDLNKARKIGLAPYHQELSAKEKLLNVLLTTYNDGRRKKLFCVGVNLLSLSSLQKIMTGLEENCSSLPLKERALMAQRLFEQAAQQEGVSLMLRKKTNSRSFICLLKTRPPI